MPLLVLNSSAQRRTRFSRALRPLPSPLPPPSPLSMPVSRPPPLPEPPLPPPPIDLRRLSRDLSPRPASELSGVLGLTSLPNSLSIFGAMLGLIPWSSGGLGLTLGSSGGSSPDSCSLATMSPGSPGPVPPPRGLPPPPPPV